MEKSKIEKYKNLAIQELLKSPNGYEVWWPSIAENIGLPIDFSDQLKSILEAQGFVQTSIRTNDGDAVRSTPKVITYLYDMEEKSEPVSITNLITTTGDGNVITTGSNNSIAVETKISKGDFNSLRKYLKSNGLGDDDISELEAIIDNDNFSDSEKKAGGNVSGWLKKMIGKAIDGIWHVSIGAAGNLLALGIQSYYGWK